jgi:hypothetical protein
MKSPTASGHVWKFFRSGGLDQVSLETAEDLTCLDQLDQELWVALSCPVRGLELDEKTLALVDADGDGRIGVPDVIAAVKWAAARLRDPAILLKGVDGLPIDGIRTDSPEGAPVAASARQILASLGRSEAGVITVAEAADTARIFSATPLNGDGIIPAAAAAEPSVGALVGEIISCCGGSTRASGVTGLPVASIEVFFTQLEAYVAWREAGTQDGIRILGDSTREAFEAVRAVRAKVDDYFTRCRLAAYDPKSAALLNPSEGAYVAAGVKALSAASEEARAFPLAQIAADRPLPLSGGVNPAWAAEVAALRDKAVGPVLGAREALTGADWAVLTGRLGAYETWLAAKPEGAVDKLGFERAKEILSGGGRAAVAALAARDAELAPHFKAIGDVERLARYHRDLRTLLHNFVNFSDFYSRDRYAAFQAGTLFLDSRSTELCLKVDGASPLAAMSKAYIVYCNCSRADGAKMTIAACFTQGDGDYLFTGRNGVFYDRQGRLWYAVIGGIVDNPISIRQAFWSPYKKLMRMIEEQIAKRAAADAEAMEKFAADADKAAATVRSVPEPKRIDLALITGIGVAIGSIGTFIATVFAKLVDIPGWQMPFILVGLMLVISLPAMVIAAIKLRQRTLGPLLEGNGWAINGRVKINIPFGAALTRMATLPPGAQRLLDDPYEDKEAAKATRKAITVFVLLVLAAASVWVRVNHNRRGHYFWEKPPAAVSK